MSGYYGIETSLPKKKTSVFLKLECLLSKTTSQLIVRMAYHYLGKLR